ncbi:MAG: universal stress protein [Cyclobacteriaceae bacterium]
MNQLKRILICLDNSETDEYILKFSKIVFDTFTCESLYFLHVAKSLDLPEEVIKKYPDLIAPVDEAVAHNLSFRINQYFEPNQYHIGLVEGDITTEILKYTKRKNVDLLVMGHKKGQGTSDVIQRRIAKLSNASLLLVPEYEIYLHPIVVPVDFSINSAMALNLAISFAKINQAEIFTLHVYHIPSGYHKTGKSYEEFAQVMENNAREDYKKFIAGIDKQGVKISDHYLLDDDHKNADKITEFVKQKNAGLIIIGSKGRTAMASLIIGSVAEKVIYLNKAIPVLIVKDKNKNMDLLEAISKL